MKFISCISIFPYQSILLATVILLIQLSARNLTSPPIRMLLPLEERASLLIHHVIQIFPFVIFTRRPRCDLVIHLSHFSDLAVAVGNGVICAIALEHPSFEEGEVAWMDSDAVVFVLAAFADELPVAFLFAEIEAGGVRDEDDG
jgi:hypothetical protein